jgi:hypothetical protein
VAIETDLPGFASLTGLVQGWKQSREADWCWVSDLVGLGLATGDQENR